MIKIGQLVSLNPKIFTYPEINANFYGDLGYPLELKPAIWEVTRLEKDLAYCKIISTSNNHTSNGDFVLLLKDLV